MKTVITEISKYLIIFTMIIFTFQCFTIFRKHDQEDKNQVLSRQIILMLFMNFIAYAVLYLQTEDIKMLVMYVSVLAFILLVQLLYRVIYKKGNLLIVNNMCMLLSIGFLILSRLKFDKAIKQFQIVVLSMALSFIVPVIVRKVKLLKDLTWLYGIVGIGLLGLVLVLATISGGAKLSIEIGGVTFQFSELVKITFVFFVAGMLREDQSFKRVVITTVVAALHVVILVLSRDLGSALVFFVAYIVMLYVATKKPLYALAGLAAGCLAAVAAYFMFNHVRQRVIAWKDPIAVYDQIGGGYQCGGEGLSLMAAAQNRDCTCVTPQQMKALVKKLTGSFDEVLVDCPAGLDRGFRTAISGAQTALIVTQDEPVCRRDAERAHMLLKREGVDECRLLVNRMRWQKGSSSTGRARELAEALEVPLLGVVPEDEAVTACAQEGKFLLERADSRAAQAIERIAGRLLGEESDIPDVTRRSLWERLRGE